jgi:hypothetical protein
MDLTLRIEFDLVIQGFDIHNPPMIPCEGEVISFRWEDFITNADDLNTLNAYCEHNFFRVNILRREYTKDHAEVIVVLFEEEHYEAFRRDLASRQSGWV